MWWLLAWLVCVVIGYRFVVLLCGVGWVIMVVMVICWECW